MYKKRCEGTKPNIYVFRREVLFVKNMEKYNAIKNGKLCMHEKKWERYNVGTDQSIGFTGDNFINEYIENM